MKTPVARCNGKVKYDKKTAKTAKNLRMKEDHIPLRIYPCPDCKGWHLTSRVRIILHEEDDELREVRKQKVEEEAMRDMPEEVDTDGDQMGED